MENRRAVYISAGAALLAIIAFFMVVEKRVENETSEYRDKEMIIVAKVDIPPQTRIDRGMLTERLWPKSLIPMDTATSYSQIENQVAIATIRQGEPLMTTKVIPFDESALNYRIPDGMRAVTIGIRDDQDVIGVGGNLKPGMFVDVLVTLFVSTKEIERGGAAAISEALNQAAAGLKAETRTVFQDVRILAVGRDARLQTAQVRRTGEVQEEVGNINITVALKPEDVQKLVLAQSIGRFTLALRPVNEKTVVPLDYTDALKTFGIKLPIVTGPPPAYREIRGGQVLAAPF